jgi:hypothetical protein
MRSPRSQRKKAKAINKRLGRTSTIKRANKYRGPGTTETSLMGGITKCWKGVCEKVDDVVTRTKIGRRDKYLNIESSQKDDPRENQFRTKYDDYSDVT